VNNQGKSPFNSLLFTVTNTTGSTFASYAPVSPNFYIAPLPPVEEKKNPVRVMVDIVVRATVDIPNTNDEGALIEQLEQALQVGVDDFVRIAAEDLDDQATVDNVEVASVDAV
jgi:hypothetical protein